MTFSGINCKQDSPSKPFGGVLEDDGIEFCLPYDAAIRYSVCSVFVQKIISTFTLSILDREIEVIEKVFNFNRNTAIFAPMLLSRTRKFKFVIL